MQCNATRGFIHHQSINFGESVRREKTRTYCRARKDTYVSAQRVSHKPNASITDSNSPWMYGHLSPYWQAFFLAMVGLQDLGGDDEEQADTPLKPVSRVNCKAEAKCSKQDQAQQR